MLRAVLVYLLIAAGGIFIAGPAGNPVVAHSGAKGVVKDRMALMERYDELMDRIYAMLHGELPYDAPSVAKAAAEIGRTAGRKLADLFPENSIDPPSEALPAIWTDFEMFRHFADRLQEFGAVVADRAKDGGPVADASVLPKKWEDVPAGRMMGGQGMTGGGTGTGMTGGGAGSGMMGGQGMMGRGPMGPGMRRMLAEAPLETVVLHMTHMCSNCHTRFRTEE